MVKFTNRELERITRELAEIAEHADDDFQLAQQSLKATNRALQNIKHFILGYTFKDKQEEIHFFKNIKPLFLSQYIYYRELYEIEANKPLGSLAQMRQYYDLVTERISVYFHRNQTLYLYYRADKSTFDELYFLRDKDYEPDPLEDTVEIDSRFSTIHSYRLSKLQAFERINEYINRCLYKLQHPDAYLPNGSERKFSNKWTDSINDLIELAYALEARGSVNYGKGKVKQIINDLALIFNVNVGNFYRSYQNMRIRKKSTTPYLDGLKESLQKRMEED